MNYKLNKITNSLSQKTIGYLIALFFYGLNSFGQNWEHVGPISTNQQPNEYGENKFETSQLNLIIAHPDNPYHMFASGKYGGLWQTLDAGENWNFINTSMLGISGVSDVIFLNSNEILVSSFFAGEFGGLDFSKNIGIYNFNTTQWQILPLISSNRHKINKIDRINDFIFAATDIGLYRLDLSNQLWELINPLNSLAVAAIDLPNDTIIVCLGINESQMNILNFQISNSNGTNWPWTQTIVSPNNQNFTETKFDFKKNENSIDFYLNSNINGIGSGNGDILLNKVSVMHSNFNTSSSQLFHAPTQAGRIAVCFDEHLSIIWYGGLRVNAYCETCSTQKNRINIKTSLQTKDGDVHMDIHSLKIITLNGSRFLYVACDGGIARANLSNIQGPVTNFNNQFGVANDNIYFVPMNNGLNVMLVYGFKGASENPNNYVIGGHDIVNTDFYSTLEQRNVLTVKTHENDGGHIDLFNNGLTIFDQSNYNFNYNVGIIDFSSGHYSSIHSNYNGFFNPILPSYGVNINNEIQADMSSPIPISDLNHKPFTSRNWIQDPYRPNRTFLMYHKKGLFQFDYTNNVFVRKFILSEMAPTGIWDGWGINYRAINGISFSPDTPNSMHIIMDGSSVTTDAIREPLIIKYIGSNLDFTYGQGYTAFGPNGQPNWELISTNLWGNLNILFNCNFSVEEIYDIELIDIETSVINQNTVYVLLRHKKCPLMKILKYEEGMWSDYGQGLPADEFSHRMIMDRMSNDGIYLSTSTGVYYRNRNMSSFTLYTDNNYPKLRVNSIEINYKENTLRIGTFGLGIWKANLVCPQIETLELNTPIAQSYHEAGSILLSSHTSSVINHPTIFRAKSSITFNPGFSANSNNSVSRYTMAFIHGCDTEGSSRNVQIPDETNYPQESKLVNRSFEENSFIIYPNPNKGQFIIKSNIFFTAVEIYSISGKKVYFQELNNVSSKKHELELDLSSGIYIIMIHSEQGTKQQKFIVSK